MINGKDSYLDREYSSSVAGVVSSNRQLLSLSPYEVTRPWSVIGRKGPVYGKKTRKTRQNLITLKEHAKKRPNSLFNVFSSLLRGQLSRNESKLERYLAYGPRSFSCLILPG